jgi:hypothetical protein
VLLPAAAGRDEANAAPLTTAAAMLALTILAKTMACSIETKVQHFDAVGAVFVPSAQAPPHRHWQWIRSFCNRRTSLLQPKANHQIGSLLRLSGQAAISGDVMRKLLVAGLFGVAVVGLGGHYNGGLATPLNDAGIRPDAQTRLAQAVDEDDEDDEDIQPDVGPSPDDQDEQGDPQAEDEDDDGAATQPVDIRI